MKEYIIWKSDGIEVQGHHVTQHEQREEIVRCRDCEQMRDWTAAEKSASYDKAELADGWCRFFRIGTYEDFFCAWGERK